MNLNVKHITLTFCLTLALMLMFNQKLVHHHHDENGDYKHQDCPVCLLSISSDSLAILIDSYILAEPQYSNVEVINKYNTFITDNYISHCFPDRAPPLR